MSVNTVKSVLNYFRKYCLRIKEYFKMKFKLLRTPYKGQVYTSHYNIFNFGKTKVCTYTWQASIDTMNVETRPNEKDTLTYLIGKTSVFTISFCFNQKGFE